MPTANFEFSELGLEYLPAIIELEKEVFSLPGVWKNISLFYKGVRAKFLDYVLREN